MTELPIEPSSPDTSLTDFLAPSSAVGSGAHSVTPPTESLRGNPETMARVSRPGREEARMMRTLPESQRDDSTFVTVTDRKSLVTETAATKDRLSSTARSLTSPVQEGAKDRSISETQKSPPLSGQAERGSQADKRFIAMERRLDQLEALQRLTDKRYRELYRTVWITLFLASLAFLWATLR